MFGSNSLYSVSPQHWEDLENISLPSLPFLQFPETPLEDEADQSDMTPHGIPIIDPHSVSDSQLEMSVMSSMAHTTITTDSLVSEYLSRWEMAEHFSKLHVLVCGFCHSVFHVIDQFRSHTTFCLGVQETPRLTDTTVRGLALVLWTNTVLRLLREQLGDVVEQKTLTRRIESKWFTLSEKVKIGWEKAAQVLRDIHCVHDDIFCGDEKQQDGADIGHEDIDMDKIEPRGQDEGYKAMDNVEDIVMTEKRKMEKTPNYYNYRDKKGRWENKNGKDIKIVGFRCEICEFTAATEWKLKRHKSTKKHLEIMEQRETKNEENATDFSTKHSCINDAEATIANAEIVDDNRGTGNIEQKGDDRFLVEKYQNVIRDGAYRHDRKTQLNRDIDHQGRDTATKSDSRQLDDNGRQVDEDMIQVERDAIWLEEDQITVEVESDRIQMEENKTEVEKDTIRLYDNKIHAERNIFEMDGAVRQIDKHTQQTEGAGRQTEGNISQMDEDTRLPDGGRDKSEGITYSE